MVLPTCATPPAGEVVLVEVVLGEGFDATGLEQPASTSASAVTATATLLRLRRLDTSSHTPDIRIDATGMGGVLMFDGMTGTCGVTPTFHTGTWELS